MTLTEDGSCVSGDEVGPVLEADSKEELAVWLACGSPVVEASDERVTEEVLGKVGNLLPSCATLADLPPTFDNVYEQVLGPSCGAPCHNPNGARRESDYSTPELAYQNLVMAPLAPSCAGAPEFYVVPDDPEASYLLHKMGDAELSDPFLCPDTFLMPYPGSQLLVAGTELVRRWIEAGAPGPGEPLVEADAGAGM